MQLRVSPRRLTAFAAYAALGPITGPLVAGVLRNHRTGHRLLSALYVLAIIETWVGLPLLAASRLKHL